MAALATFHTPDCRTTVARAGTTVRGAAGFPVFGSNSQPPSWEQNPTWRSVEDTTRTDTGVNGFGPGYLRPNCDVTCFFTKTRRVVVEVALRSG